jgi:predicted RNA-binding protein YlxR (DUF448 family)
VAKKVSRRQKHVPQRMCVVCRQRYDKRRLTRVVNTAEDGVIVDLSGKRNGRGAYLCDQVACWDKAISDNRLLNQALNAEVTPDERAMLATHRPAAEQLTE